MPATDDWGHTTPNPLSAIGVAVAFALAQPAPPPNGRGFASTTFPKRNMRSSTSAGRTDGTPGKGIALGIVPPCRASEFTIVTPQRYEIDRSFFESPGGFR